MERANVSGAFLTVAKAATGTREALPIGYLELTALQSNRMPEFRNMKTWTDYLGHSRLRSFTDEHGHL
jgi:hypothetical protein